MNMRKKAWAVFSQMIRLRDADGRGYCRCISCSTVKPWNEMQAGHFIPKGSDRNLEFHPDNVHAQCVSCNMHKSGNLIEYRFGLVRKIGKSRVERLETLHQMRHASKAPNDFELKIIWTEAKAELARLKSKKL